MRYGNWDGDDVLALALAGGFAGVAAAFAFPAVGGTTTPLFAIFFLCFSSSFAFLFSSFSTFFLSFSVSTFVALGVSFDFDGDEERLGLDVSGLANGSATMPAAYPKTGAG